MKSRTVTLSAVVLAAGIGLAACSSGSSSSTTSTMSAGGSVSASGSATASKNIVQVAAGDPQLSTLVTAVKAAGLVQTLEGKGPFTVFAPTNAAFSALPAGTVQTLLEPANKSTLTSILTYHVVPGAYTSSNLPMGSVKTVNGADITLSEQGGVVKITDGKGNTVQVTTANIKASNGVIHIISGVLMPPTGS